MSASLIRGRGLFPLLLILAAIAYWWLHPSPPKAIAIGYIPDRSVLLWNTPAQVRQQVAELHYGDRVEIVRQEGAAAQVRTPAGVLGWLLDSRQIMDSVLWQQVADLLARARTLPVQARGITKTVSNVRIEPGRNARRVFQFTRGTPVAVLERTVAEAAQANEEPAPENSNPGDQDRKPKQEDWLLVLRTDGPKAETGSSSAEPHSASPGGSSTPGPVSGGAGPAQNSAAGGASPPIAGWVLARFIELSLPGPVRDYASSADIHVVASFELNRVADGSGGEAGQYLIAGARGGEGQPCDFTMLRVYTWGAARKRYETAYVENKLCGRLPVRVSSSPAGPEFRFLESGGSAAERVYVMRQTVVRRVKQGASNAAQPRH
jgi:hypothetical protein